VYLSEENADKKPVEEQKVEVKAKLVKSSDGKEPAHADNPEAAKEKPAESHDRGYSRGGGYSGGRYSGSRGDGESRYLSNDEKLKIYKKQSEERLLDIKRSREAKIGKKRIR